jgi:hypothetical protein
MKKHITLFTIAVLAMFAAASTPAQTNQHRFTHARDKANAVIRARTREAQAAAKLRRRKSVKNAASRSKNREHPPKSIRASMAKAPIGMEGGRAKQLPTSIAAHANGKDRLKGKPLKHKQS